MKSAVVIFSRMGSTRLPGKALRKIAGRELLGHVIDRCKQTGHDVVVNTTHLPEDDALEAFAVANGVRVWRLVMDENDVLSRALGCARGWKFDYIARICGDTPFIDPAAVCGVLTFAMHHQYDLSVNTFWTPEKFVEAIPIWTLERLHRLAVTAEDREHVTKYVYDNAQLFRVAIPSMQWWPTMAFTVDTEADLARAEQLIAEGKITW